MSLLLLGFSLFVKGFSSTLFISLISLISLRESGFGSRAAYFALCASFAPRTAERFGRDFGGLYSDFCEISEKR
jgi:hypothetical protein